MQTYRFTLLIEGEVTVTQINKFSKAARDGSTPRGSGGIWQVDFSREAESFETAIATAREQVQQSGLTIQGMFIGADAVRSMGLVGQ